MSQRSIRDGELKIKDGTGSPLELTVRIGEGNFTWNERRNVDYTRDRGIIAEVRLGDDEAIEVSFDFIWEWISDITGTATIVEALKGTANSWISAGDVCEPYAVDLELHILADECGSIDELITFNEFRWETINADLRAGSISCTGRCMSYTAV